MNYLCQGFRKLPSDRHTDIQTITQTNNDGGHTIRFAALENPIHANVMAISAIEPDL